MRVLFVPYLFIALIVGFAIAFVAKITGVKRGVKYDPPLSEAELHDIRSMTFDEMEAAFAKPRINMTRWEMLRDSVPYEYFRRGVARAAIVPCCGVFMSCMWIGWMQSRRFTPTTS